jgi:multicomponent Na+:H+ antiporter subunit E
VILKLVLLAVVWAALGGDFSTADLAFGLILGGAVLALARPLGASRFARVRIGRLPGFVVLALWEILLANLRLIPVVLGPRRLLQPAIVAVPLEVDRDAEILLLANLISLTPGTLSLEISEDRRMLYVHAVSASDPEALRMAIKQRLERRVLAVFR